MKNNPKPASPPSSSPAPNVGNSAWTEPWKIVVGLLATILAAVIILFFAYLNDTRKEIKELHENIAATIDVIEDRNKRTGDLIENLEEFDDKIDRVWGSIYLGDGTDYQKKAEACMTLGGDVDKGSGECTILTFKSNIRVQSR